MKGAPSDFQAHNLSGIYRGIVIATNDPLKAGRVQIKIYPMFEGVTDSDLPWAVPADPFMGGFTNVGGVFVPTVGAIMWCFFENCDHRYPVYFAGAPSMVAGTPQIPAHAATNYPNRKVYRSNSGVEIIIDDTPGSVMLQISTASGWSMTVDNAGDETDNIPGTWTTTVKGDMTLNAEGTVTANVTGTMNVTGATDINVTSATTIALSAPIVSINGS